MNDAKDIAPLTEALAKKIYDLRYEWKNKLSFDDLFKLQEIAFELQNLPYATVDSECICHGNWRKIIKDNEHLIGKIVSDNKGNLYYFYGIVHADDDYYYGLSAMDKKNKDILSSCVGPFDYTVVEK